MSNPPQQNFDELIKKSREIYDQLQKNPNFEIENSGKYIAFEPSSGGHFIGETRDEAIKSAKQKNPDSIVFVKRIGGPEKISRNFFYPDPLDYARIF